MYIYKNIFVNMDYIELISVYSMPPSGLKKKKILPQLPAETTWTSKYFRPIYFITIHLTSFAFHFIAHSLTCSCTLSLPLK